MDKLFNGKIKNVIRDTLKIDEALSAQEKKFTFNSDFLSNDNYQNHVELYQGYLKNFNTVSAKLDTADRQNVNCNHSEFRSLKLDETFNMNGVYLHELYFANIGDVNSEIKMDSLAYMRLSRDFGSFDAWQKDFIACALSARNGWAVTVYNGFLKRYINTVIDLHSSNVPINCYPIIVMDVWEHAYYRDYMSDRKSYVFGMMKQLNWETIESRFKKAEAVAKALK